MANLQKTKCNAKKSILLYTKVYVLAYVSYKWTLLISGSSQTLRVYTLRKRLFTGHQGSRIEIFPPPLFTFISVYLTDVSWRDMGNIHWHLIRDIYSKTLCFVTQYGRIMSHFIVIVFFLLHYHNPGISDQQGKLSSAIKRRWRWRFGL